MWVGFAVVLKNAESELARLARHVESFVEYHGLESKLAFTMNLCFDELITNTIHYGFDDSEYHPIFVGMWLRETALEITICDGGRPYDPFREVEEPDLSLDIEDRPIGGLGVFFVKEFMDQVSYAHEGGKNLVVLRKNIVQQGDSGVDIRQEESGDVTVLVPQARVDSNTAGAFEALLLNVLGEGKTRLIIDFSDLDYISSAGLRVVLIGAKSCKAKGGKLVLCSMKDHIHEVFAVSGFTKILTIVGSRDEALALF